MARKVAALNGSAGTKCGGRAAALHCVVQHPDELVGVSMMIPHANQRRGYKQGWAMGEARGVRIAAEYNYQRPVTEGRYPMILQNVSELLPEN